MKATEASGGLENFRGGHVGRMARVISLPRGKGQRTLGIEFRFDREVFGVEPVDRIDQESFRTVREAVEEALHFLGVIGARYSRPTGGEQEWGASKPCWNR